MKLETHEKGAKDDAWETKPWGGRGLDVLWCEDLDHAQVFDDRKARARLLRVIAEYTKRDEKDQIRV